jgi:Lrp/AsnC family transcriptional regulator for asnA, asnC and gidA
MCSATNRRGRAGSNGTGTATSSPAPEHRPLPLRTEESSADDSLLDRTNRAIIEALQLDGRRPFAQIATEVGLSEAAVRRRVNQLRDRGVMEIVAVTDPLQLGFTRQALVGIKVEGDVRQVAAKIVPLPEVDYVVMCAGSFDILVELVCEDDDRLLHVLNDSIRSIPGVSGTETFMYLKLAKQTYTWGTR